MKWRKRGDRGVSKCEASGCCASVENFHQAQAAGGSGGSGAAAVSGIQYIDGIPRRDPTPAYFHKRSNKIAHHVVEKSVALHTICKKLWICALGDIFSGDRGTRPLRSIDSADVAGCRRCFRLLQSCRPIRIASGKRGEIMLAKNCLRCLLHRVDVERPARASDIPRQKR